MNLQEILYSTILFVAALGSLSVAALVWQRRHAPGGMTLTFFMLGLAWWSGTYALFWLHLPPSGIFWLNVTYFGVVTVIPFFFVFVLQFTHRQQWLSNRLFALLGGMGLLTLVLLWTDPWHGLFFAGLRSETDSVIFSGGPWFWTFIIYAYSLNLLALLLLAKEWRTSQRFYRRQLGLLLLAGLLPWLANVLSLLNLNPLPGLDLTPLAFTLTGGVTAVTLHRHHFLDVLPIARDKVVEQMRDGILVLDAQNRIVDFNPAFSQLTALKEQELIGQTVAQVWPDWAQLDDLFREAQEIQLPGNPPTFLHVRLIPLTGNRQQAQGKLVIVRNISKRKEMEAEREELIETLQNTLAQVKTLRGLLPICANCKKIRDDDGYWQDVAVYVRDHTEAEFSHSICPECIVELYPEIYKYK
ncbi:MAG: histidine kinase N-terminal 7TM domain-containing protein [Chloroflexota bacterium]